MIGFNLAWFIGATGMAIDWANPIAVTGATTLTAGKHHVMTGSTADYSVTLPTAASSSGQLLSVEMSAALTKLVTIDGDGAETIDGAANRVMWAKETAVLLSNGTTWTKIGGKSIPMDMMIYRSSIQSGVATATFTKILYGTVDHNLGFGDDIANNQMIVNRSGTYSLFITGTMNNSLNTGGIYWFITEDNDYTTKICFKTAQGYGTAPAIDPTAVACRTAYLTKGRTLNGYAYHSTGSNRDLQGSGIFQIALGATEVLSW